MKKILYLITFCFSFLILKSNCFAYTSNFIYNYDEMINFVSDNHYTILEKIKDKFKNTDYHYYSYIITREHSLYSGTCNTDYDVNSDSSCTNQSRSIDDNGLMLVVFNPVYNNRIYFAGSSGVSNARPTRFGFFPSTDSDSQVKHAQNIADFQRVFYITLDNIDSLLDSFLANPSYGRFSNTYSEAMWNFSGVNNSISDYSLGFFWKFGTSNSTTAITRTWNFVPIFFYKNFESLTYGTYNYNDTIRQPLNFTYIYNNESITLDYGVNFPFLNELSNSSPDLSETNRVIKYDDDFYGFFNNYLIINNIYDDGNSVLGSAINCVENESDLDLIDNSRLFSNGYCLFNNSDKSPNINDNQFLDTYFAFSNLIGDSSVNYLHNNNYYLYSFRVLKPFTPNISHLVFDTTNGSFNVPISNVYKYDGGSYVDYVIKFYLEFDAIENLDPTASLKAITIIFNDKVSNYYSSYNDFAGFSVFRSFKLKWFSSNPNSTDVSEFYSNEDLSKIDGVERTNNFFTDTTFNTFGFSGIITAPFRFLYALESYNSCSSISLPFPHSNQSITLACVSDSIPNSINPLIVVLQTILSGIICYYIGVNTLATIKEILTPDKDTVEVVDL